MVGLTLAVEMGDLGYVVRSRDVYDELYQKLYVDPENALDDPREEGDDD